MTWKEFKDCLESKGVTDNMEIEFLDTYPIEGSVKVIINKEDNEFHVL